MDGVDGRPGRRVVQRLPFDQQRVRSVGAEPGRVDFVDGAQVGAEDTVAPYSFSWSSGSVPNGAHTLTAVARDLSGNETTSAPVAIDVHNVISSGLVAAWSFDEGSGDVADDVTGRGHAGAISNAVWSAAGKYGGALLFDGVNDRVRVNDSTSLHLTTAVRELEGQDS